MRSKELSLLKISQVKKTKIEGTNAYIVKSTMGDVNGNCKNSKVSLKEINKTPKEVPIFDVDETDGLLNVYKDIEKCLEARMKTSVPENIHNRFLLGINRNASRFP